MGTELTPSVSETSQGGPGSWPTDAFAREDAEDAQSVALASTADVPPGGWPVVTHRAEMREKTSYVHGEVLAPSEKEVPLFEGRDDGGCAPFREKE